eukprot:TRINITY_DN2328_c0_g1_i3.p1 TRINITY_DN2328_c0_g1~~TRINITY_DN2328_c0_g1_i3.p1  ORF type:complete len:642 (-),score=125.53 TRINITY_DN2328_c0_g1_i3:262-2187(-)
MTSAVGQSSLGKSASIPALLRLGSSVPKLEGNEKKISFGFKTPGEQKSAVSFLKGSVSQTAIDYAMALQNPNWRLDSTEKPKTPPPLEQDCVPKNMVYPREQPAWLKHDKQVLRFYGYFQESVCERPDENSRYRHVSFMYFMEDGTMRMSEPRVENSGIPQGLFLRRHRVPRDDGNGFVGPDDFRVGQMITLYGRTYHVTGCDCYTRWFYEQCGIQQEDDEPPPQDAWQKSYRLNKIAEKGGLVPSKAAVDSKNLTKFQIGQPPADKKFSQFLLNDRKVLRFKGFWDDHTLYGARLYFIIHYYLCDNTCEINEAHCRNSGRWTSPVFMTRGPLHKRNNVNVCPGMLDADPPRYMPEDFTLGDCIYIWGRKVVLYDCDDFTQKFYLDFLGRDQHAGRVDVSEKPVTHLKLAPPPHNGIGKEEDSLISTQMIMPKAPKIDLAKMMTLTGEVLRFEAKMVNGEPEDDMRKLVIAFYPADDEVAVFEEAIRNSGHWGGKFAEKRRMTNPATGKRFALNDFFVGQTVVICSQPLQITRADEHCLQFLEAHPEEFPYSDPIACAAKILELADEPEIQFEGGIDPDRLKLIAAHRGVRLVDHEIITLLRKFGTTGVDGNPLIAGNEVLQLGQQQRSRRAASPSHIQVR